MKDISKWYTLLSLSFFARCPLLFLAAVINNASAFQPPLQVITYIDPKRFSCQQFRAKIGLSSSTSLSFCTSDDQHKNESTSEENVPSIIRLYTGEDGESHFETIPLDMQPFSDSEGSFGMATSLLESQGIIFRTSPPGYSLDWHCAPRRQYIIQLTGTTEIEVGVGESSSADANSISFSQQKILVGPGDVLLAEDLTGRGHCTRVVGSEQRFYAVLPLD